MAQASEDGREAAMNLPTTPPRDRVTDEDKTMQNHMACACAHCISCQSMVCGRKAMMGHDGAVTHLAGNFQHWVLYTMGVAVYPCYDFI